MSLVREEWDDEESSIEQEEYLTTSNAHITSDEMEARRFMRKVEEVSYPEMLEIEYEGTQREGAGQKSPKEEEQA